MVLYISTMVPSIAPKTSNDMLYERDSLAELTAREHAVYEDLENIRSYQFEGHGRIFGVEKQHQVQGEAGNTSHSSGSRLDGPAEGTEMDTDETPTSSEEEGMLEEEEEDGEGLFLEGQRVYEMYDDDEDEESEEFW